MKGLELRGAIVVPGDSLGAKLRRGDYVYLDGDDIRAGVFGVKEEKKGIVSVIPLEGKYIPKEGDMVVGVVTTVMRTGWLVAIGAGYTSYLNKEKDRYGDDDPTFDLRRLYKEGDILSVKISRVDEIKESYADGPRKLVGGRIVMVNAKKIPRVIGSKKSMLSILRDKSGCRVIVGQNGVIWLDGQEQAMQVVIDAILKIERESHTKGLTDRISEFMDAQMKEVNKNRPIIQSGRERGAQNGVEQHHSLERGENELNGRNYAWDTEKDGAGQNEGDSLFDDGRDTDSGCCGDDKI